jgi:fibronectin-binding autotransporter adhesin
VGWGVSLSTSIVARWLLARRWSSLQFAARRGIATPDTKKTRRLIYAATRSARLVALFLGVCCYSGAAFSQVNIDLAGAPQSVNALSGPGTVTNTGGTGETPAVLTIDGGAPSTFSGTIADGLGCTTCTTGLIITRNTLQTLTNYGGNTYSGPTQIDLGSTLAAGAQNAFSPNSAVNNNGTLDLGSLSQTIGRLYGSGMVGNFSDPTGATNSNPVTAVLTVNNGGAFSGSIVDGTVNTSTTNPNTSSNYANNATTSLTLASGTLTLTGNNYTTSSSAAYSNTYSGNTKVNGTAILAAGAVNAFSPNSAIFVASGATLDLGSLNQTIAALNGSGTVTSLTDPTGVTNSGAGSPAATAVLTVNNGGSFSGQIADGNVSGVTNATTALTLAGGTLTLSGTNNTYSGATTISNGATLDVEGSIASATTVKSGGTLMGGGAVGREVIVNNGGTLAPGGSVTPTLAIGGNLTLTNNSPTLDSGSNYVSQIGTASATYANVTGTANLAGLFTAVATASSTSYSATDQSATNIAPYTVLTASSINGAFKGISISGNFGDLVPFLSYSTVGSVRLGLTAGTAWTGASTLSPTAWNWSDGGNWSGGQMPSSPNSTPALTVATFGASASQTSVTIDTAATAGTLLFTTGAPQYGFTITSGNSLTLNGIGIINNSTYAPQFSIASGATFDVSGVTGALVVPNIPFNLTGVATGTLQDYGNVQSGGGTINLGGNALYINQTANGIFSGVISGTANPLTCNNGCPQQGISLVKDGIGTLTLAGINTYTGYTGILNGTLALSGSGSISNSGGVAIFPGGVFDISELSSGGSAPAIAVINSLQSAGNSNTGGTVFLGSNNLTVQTTGGSSGGAQFGGVIADCSSGRISCLASSGSGVTTGGSLTVEGSGTLTLTGANTYTGATTIENSATLALSTNCTNCNGSGGNNFVPLAGTSGDVHTSSALSISSGAAFDISQLFANATVGGSVVSTPATTQVAAINGSGYVYLGSNRLIIGEAPNLNSSFSGVISDCGTGGNLCAAAQNCNNCGGGPMGGSLVMNGSGTLILSGANTYSGGTTLSGGILQVGADTILSSGAIVSSAIGTGQLTFGGGTLQAGGPYTIANAATIASNGGTIDSNSQTSTYSGAIGGAGGLIITDSSGSGTVILTNTNTYQGGTTINSGGTLRLGIGGTTGSITGNVIDNGALAFDLSSNNTFVGIISGSGSVSQIGTGTTILTGTNTYTGQTTISGGTLALTGSGSIANSSAVAIASGGTFDISQTGSGASIVTLTDYGANPSGIVALGSQTLTITNGSTTFSGVIADGGLGSGMGGNLTIAGGTQTLAGVNTYTGATTIAPTSGMATLALTGSGSIATSSGIYIATGGTFDISGVNRPLNLSGSGIPFSLVGTTINSLQSSGGIVNLGGNALYINQTTNGTFSGVIEGTATPLNCNNGCPQQGISLVKDGLGTLTLAGVNTYTGYTGILDGTLALSGSGDISKSAGVAIFSNGTFDISGVSGTGTTVASIQNGSGVGGSIYLGDKTLTVGTTTGPLANQNQNSQFSGGISGGGGLTAAGTGILTLAGTNTYIGATTINAGTLALGMQYQCSPTCAPPAMTPPGGSISASSGVAINTGAAFDISQLFAVSNGSVVPATAMVSAISNGASGGGNIYLGSNTLIVGISGAAMNANLSSSFSGVISDGGLCGINCTGGSLFKDGDGTLILSGANTYTGGTTVNAGTLSLAHATAGTIDAAATGTIGINGGALELATSGTLNNGIVINGSPATIEATYGTTGTLGGTFTDHVGSNAGTLLIGSSTDTGTIVFAPSSLNVNALSAIEVAGGTLQAGAGTSALGSLTASAQTTQIDANATLDFNGNSGAGATIAYLQGTGTLTNSGGATTVIQGGNFAGTITGGGNVEVSTGTLTLSGTNGYTGATLITAGTLTIGPGGSIAASSSLTDSGTFQLDSNAVATFTGAVSNSGTITIGGAGSNLATGAGITNNSAGTISVAATGAVNGALVSNANATTRAINNAGVWMGDANNGGALNNSGTWTTQFSGFSNGGTLAQTAGMINAAAGGFTNTGTVNASGGAINGAIVNGSGSNAGTFDVTGTVTSNSTFANALGSTLTVNGGSYSINGAVSNSGTITIGITTAGSLTTQAGIANGGAITVYSGSSLTDLSTAGITNTGIISNYGTVSAALTNYGTVTNEASGNWTGNVTSLSGTITNDGTWTGNVTGNALLIQNNGTWNPSNVATTNFNNAGTADMSGTLNATTVTNTGTFTVETGGLTGTITTFNNNGGTLAVGSNTFTGIGTLNNAAAITIGANGSLTAGTITQSTGGSITNTGGTLDGTTSIAINAGTVTSTGTVTTPLLTNAGTADMSGALNAATVTNTNSFNVESGGLTGTITTFNNNGGMLAVGGNSFTGIAALNNAAAITIGANGSLTAGTITQSTGGSITNTGGALDGTASIAINAGTLTSTGMVTTPLLTNGGTADMSGTLNATTVNNTNAFNVEGGLSGTITTFNNNGGTLAVSGNSFAGIAALNNAAAITIGANGSLTAGTITQSTGGGITNTGGTLDGATSIAINAGTLTSTGTVTTPLLTNAGTADMSGALSATTVTNTGTVNVESGGLTGTITTFNNNGGTLAVGGNSFTGIGTLNNAAAITIASDGTLSTTSLTNTGTVNASGGAINGAITNGSGGTAGTFDATGAVTSNSNFANALAGSTLTVNGGGSYAIAGAVTNSGTLTVGSASTSGNLTADAGITNNAGGQIIVSVNGTLTDALTNYGAVTDAGAYNANVTNESTGTISNTGTWTGNLVVNSNTTTGAINNSGIWIGDANNAGALTNSGTWTTQSSGFSNSGTLTQTAGTINATIGGFTNTGTVNASGGAINGAIVNGAGGAFNVTGTVNSNSTFNNSTITSALTINNGGIYTIAGAVANSGAITINAGGSLTDLASAGITNNSTGIISNYGTVSATLTNSGAVTNEAGANWIGTVSSVAGSIINDGTWTGNVTGNAALVQNYGTWNATNEAAINFNNAGIADMSGTLNATTVTNTGTFNVETGGLSGPIGTFNNNAGGTLAVGGNSFTGVGALNNAAAISISTSGSLTASTITQSIGGTINNTGGSLDGTTSIAINAGTLTSTGTVTTPLLTNAGTVNMAGALYAATVNNSGSFNVTGGLSGAITTFNNNSGGTLAVGDNTLTDIGTLNNAAAITIGSGGSFTAGTIAQTGGSINSSGALIGSTSIAINSGTLTSTGTVTTPLLTNAGTADMSGALNASTVTNTNTFNVGSSGLTGAITTFNNKGGALAVGTNSFTGIGALNNTAASTVGMGGTLTAASITQSAGSITSGGTLTGTTSIAINGGTLTSTGTVATPLLSNAGIADMSGTLNTATVTNTGTFTAETNGLNGSIGTFSNNTGGTLAIGGNPFTGITTLTNAGTLTIGSTGTLSTTNLINTGTINASGGTIKGTVAMNGGTLNVTGSLSVTGSLAFATASTYMVAINGSSTGSTNVTGSATIASGAALKITALNPVVGATYNLLTTTAGITGANFSVSVTGTTDTISLSYNVADTELEAKFTNSQKANPQLSASQQPSGFGPLINVINTASSTGALPSQFQGLFNLPTGSQAGALSQLSGQSNSGGAVSASAMQNSFSTTLLNPNIGSRGGSAGAFGPALGFAPDPDDAPAQKAIYDAVVPTEPLDALMRSMQPYYSHSVWASAYGGYAKLTGNSDIGSPTATTYGGGLASGIDYRLGPNTVAGLAVGGGGTSWSLSGGDGGGLSNIFQVGAYASQRFGNAYLSGALAYAFDWMNTNRNVTMPEVANLTANFLASGPTARLETGYRFVTPEMGITPYVASEFSALRTPTYSESTASGAQGYALSYDAQTTINGREEVGLWIDKALQLESNSTLLLRGRVGYAYDWWNNDNLTAQFASLPTQSFTMTGITPPTSVGLASLMSEVRYPNGVSLSTKIDAEFASGSYSFTGTGTFRYSW